MKSRLLKTVKKNHKKSLFLITTNKMKKAILLLTALLIVSCSKDDPLRLLEYGYVNFKGQLFVPDLSAKYEVPECSEEIPTSIAYIFRDKDGLTWAKQSPITIKDNAITVINEIELPVGLYTVEDIAIVSNNGTITHRVPSSETVAFDFTSFVENPTPYLIEILPEQTTETTSQLVCYTSQLLELSGGFGGRTEILDLETLYIELPSGFCVDQITIESDGRQIIDFDIAGIGIRGFPIIADFDLMVVRAYQNENLLSQVNILEYKPGERITNDEVIQLRITCN